MLRGACRFCRAAPVCVGKRSQVVRWKVVESKSVRASSKESSPDRQTATVSRITVRDGEGRACCDLHRLSRMKMMAIEGEGEEG